MAIEKTDESPYQTGSHSNYIRLALVRIVVAEQLAEIGLDVWTDKASYDAGKDPIRQVQITVGPQADEADNIPAFGTAATHTPSDATTLYNAIASSVYVLLKDHPELAGGVEV